jgi:hypothetical protein
MRSFVILLFTHVIRVVKWKKVRWEGYVAHVKRGLHTGKHEGKRPLGRPRRRSVDNIKMNLKEVGRGCLDWIYLAEAGSCGQGNELTNSIKCRDLFFMAELLLVCEDPLGYMEFVSYKYDHSVLQLYKIPFLRNQNSSLQMSNQCSVSLSIASLRLPFQADGVKSRHSQWDPSLCPTAAAVSIDHLLDARFGYRT